MTDKPTTSYPGMPHWAKVQGVFLILFLLTVINMFTGVISPALFGLEGFGHAPPGGHQ